MVVTVEREELADTPSYMEEMEETHSGEVAQVTPLHLHLRLPPVETAALRVWGANQAAFLGR